MNTEEVIMQAHLVAQEIKNHLWEAHDDDTLRVKII